MLSYSRAEQESLQLDFKLAQIYQLVQIMVVRGTIIVNIRRCRQLQGRFGPAHQVTLWPIRRHWLKVETSRFPQVQSGTCPANFTGLTPLAPQAKDGMYTFTCTTPGTVREVENDSFECMSWCIM